MRKRIQRLRFGNVLFYIVVVSVFCFFPSFICQPSVTFGIKKRIKEGEQPYLLRGEREREREVPRNGK